MIPIGTKVKVVEDVEKSISIFLGKEGKVIGYKWNKFREEKNLPVVQFENGQVISGWSLWYEVL